MTNISFSYQYIIFSRFYLRHCMFNCFRKRYIQKRLPLQDNTSLGKISLVIQILTKIFYLRTVLSSLVSIVPSPSLHDISTYNNSKIVLLCLIIQQKSDKKIVNGASKGSYFLKLILAECKVGNISCRKFRKRLEIQQTAPCTQ